MGLIGGFCHLYIGQEAVVVGLESVAEEGDKRITSYRDHGHMLACGMDANGVMAELTDARAAIPRGKAARCTCLARKTFLRRPRHRWGAGAAGCRIGLCRQVLRNNGRVTFTYFGDGAANQGQVYETFNMAALWDLPVVFVIENNQYAMGTAQNRSTSTPDLWTRGAAFGIDGEAVDGMDVLAVKEAGEKAVAHCRAGKGPYILEVKTYRYRGHSMSDPAKYRTREEVQKVREEKDAIEHVRDLLLQGGHATEDELKAIDKDIKNIVNKAADFARESPEPALEELWTDIYADA